MRASWMFHGDGFVIVAINHSQNWLRSKFASPTELIRSNMHQDNPTAHCIPTLLKNGKFEKRKREIYDQIKFSPTNATKSQKETDLPASAFVNPLSVKKVMEKIGLSLTRALSCPSPLWRAGHIAFRQSLQAAASLSNC